MYIIDSGLYFLHHIKRKTLTKMKKNYLNTSIFINLYNDIIKKNSWVDKYLSNFGNNRLYYSILFIIYNNVKNLITRISFNSYFCNSKFAITVRTAYIIFISNIITFFSPSLNVVYATLTVIYVILGWLLDYISYMWLLVGESMSLKRIATFTFWVQHFMYAILYIIWLYMGVITTNGVYFSALNKSYANNFYLTIFIAGSIMSYISSGLWYIYGKPTVSERLRLRDDIILPLLTSQTRGIRASGLIIQIASKISYFIFSPISFNLYTTLRRSVFEWFSFLGMVFSTYVSWDWYILNIFYRFSIMQNVLIWILPCITSGFGLIYTEGVRPRMGYVFYGIIYLTFWTSICFFTNSIVVGYYDVNNAASALFYFIPINLVIAFVYPLPLYRGNVQLSLITRLLHLSLFIVLTSITLISAGLIWYIISPT